MNSSTTSKLSIVASLFLGLTACSSKPVIMTGDDVKVSREGAPKNCQEIGTVSGATSSVHATQEDALADMKKEAARKGANFVKVEQFSDTGTAVTGIAYNCP